MKIVFKVNGKGVAVDVSPVKTLLNVLREDLGLTGTKEGCGVGECGACSVLMDGRVVTSCLVLAADLEGREIYTIEGLKKDREGKAVQEAFVEEGAVQCGYCIPGFIVAGTAALKKNPDPTRKEVKEALAGNICRCAAYTKIFQAVEKAAQSLKKKR